MLHDPLGINRISQLSQCGTAILLVTGQSPRPKAKSLNIAWAEEARQCQGNSRTLRERKIMVFLAHDSLDISCKTATDKPTAWHPSLLQQLTTTAAISSAKAFRFLFRLALRLELFCLSCQICEFILEFTASEFGSFTYSSTTWKLLGSYQT